MCPTARGRSLHTPPRPHPGPWGASAWEVGWVAWSSFMTRSFWSFPRFGSVGRQMMVKGEELLGSRLHPRSFTSPEGVWERPPITPSKVSWQLLGHRSSWLHHTRCGHHTFVFARSFLQAPAQRRARLQATASALPGPVVARESQGLCVALGQPQSLPSPGEAWLICGEGAPSGAAHWEPCSTPTPS